MVSACANNMEKWERMGQSVPGPSRGGVGGQARYAFNLSSLKAAKWRRAQVVRQLVEGEA